MIEFEPEGAAIHEAFDAAEHTLEAGIAIIMAAHTASHASGTTVRRVARALEQSAEGAVTASRSVMRHRQSPADRAGLVRLETACGQRLLDLAQSALVDAGLADRASKALLRESLARALEQPAAVEVDDCGAVVHHVLTAVRWLGASALRTIIMIALGLILAWLIYGLRLNG